MNNLVAFDCKSNFTKRDVMLSGIFQVEANKQSGYKFVRVLEGLREWEVCSPDVSAAIEFCREKIIEMPVDEFEEWFKNQFPAVSHLTTIFLLLNVTSFLRHMKPCSLKSLARACRLNVALKLHLRPSKQLSQSGRSAWRVLDQSRAVLHDQDA